MPRAMLRREALNRCLRGVDYSITSRGSALIARHSGQSRQHVSFPGQLQD